MGVDYDDIRGLLAAKKLLGLTGGGATEIEIDAAERQLCVRLPVSYKSFLKEYGWGYFGSLELLCGLGADIPQEWEPGANIVRVTLDERNGPLNLPGNFVPFCQNGAGDWYVIGCTPSGEPEAPIFFVNHEKSAAGSLNVVTRASSFADWLKNRLSES